MEATLSFSALIALIFVALIFDFLNGVHDAANSIATVVSTRVLRPHYAVAWAAFFNFIAFLFFGLHVAQTVGTGIVAAEVVDAAVIFGALMGAICWNLITWWLGIPSSSSHALIGGLAGAAVTKAGLGSIVWSGLGITAAAIVLSPLLGFLLALVLVLAVSWAFVRSTPAAVDNTFRSLQLISAALYSLGHGGNDAQKTMGIITLALIAHGDLPADKFDVPSGSSCRPPPSTPATSSSCRRLGDAAVGAPARGQLRGRARGAAAADHHVHGADRDEKVDHAYA
jgi:PiT family inorganic phosphate transporter